jgi:tetratricopeptide (TPR) repeat protein
MADRRDNGDATLGVASGRRRRLSAMLRLTLASTTALVLLGAGLPAKSQTPPQSNTAPVGAGSEPARTPSPQTVPAQPRPSPAGVAVRLRAGEHPTYTRLVFDWPERVDYTLNTEGRQASLRFARPAAIDLGRLAQFPPRHVTGLAAGSDTGATTVSFAVPEGAAVKAWRDGAKVVLDITPAAAAEAKPAEVKPAEPKPAETKAPAPAAKAADAKPDPKPPAAAPRPVVPPATAAAPAPVAPAPVAPAPATAPAGVAAAPQTKAPQTNTPPAATTAPPAAMTPALPLPAASGVPAAAPITDVASAPLGTFMPAPQMGPIRGEPLVPAVDSSRTGPLLNFPWSRPVAAAAFMRNGNLWVVFDRVANVDLRPITTRDWGGAINSIEQVPVAGMTVLRLQVPGGTTAAFTRRNTGWQISINTIQPEQLVPKDAAPAEEALSPRERALEIDVRRQLDADGGAKLFFAANDPSPQMLVPDPDTGDVLTVVPFAGANGGVPGRRDFIELSVLPSFQGFAIEPHADNLAINRFPRGIEIGTASGLSLSAPRGADPKSGTTDILRFDDWRKVEGATYGEQEEMLLRRIAMSTPGQRPAARLALAQFYAANDMQPETLSVLAKARAEQPDLERDKLYRALRGIANLRLGRHADAANDLDSKIFDDDPDILAYRGMLAAERDDWPSARRSFSLAGAAVAKFPPDLRAPLRLTMARSWLAGGDITAATAELRALEGDALTRGRAAEGDYIRGLLADATNKPEEAIRHFDQAAGSGDRRARALAEYAKTDMMLSRKLIDTPQAIERLDSLRFAWRGGPYEFNLLRRLGELQFSIGDLRGGITTFRQIVKYFPKSPEMPLLTRQMSDEFAKLFLDGGAQALPPLNALALYYDYRELTPLGPEGDEIIGKLADRLVSVDLLNRAAELLEHQIQHRLRGEDRAKAGARLAVVYLLDRNPDAALKSLQATQAANLSPAVQMERRQLEARALGDLDRFPEALNLIASDQSNEARALRADLHWRGKDWVAFARVVSQMVGNRHADPAPLLADERKLVMQLAVAYSLTNDTAALDDVRRKYEAKFRDTPDAQTFTAVSSTLSRAAGDPREMAAAIAQVGQYEAFMSRYRERVSKGGLSAIN